MVNHLYSSVAERKKISARLARPWVPNLALILSWAPVLLFIAAAFGLWELSVRLADVAPWLLPPPSSLFDELYQSRTLLWEHTLVTLQEVLLGLAVALGAGVLLAASMALSRLLHRGLYPFVIASQTVPIIAIAPLLLIWVGYGLTAKVIVVALISFFPIVVNMIDGIKSVDSDTVNMLRSFGATRWQIFAKLQVPSSMPSLFSGVKIAASVSVIGAVIGEWVGASQGLGYLMTRDIPQFQTDRVFAAIFILAFMGVALFLIAVLAERIALPWRRPTSNMES
ncbi:MAG: ABC transporter permease [SAR202 cluster bacterium]|nr:ABC transporter permease [SAR202 cluster bacterium]